MATTSSTWLKLKEVLDELNISQTTFDLWKTDGRAPRCYKLPNGQYRIRRIDFEAWLAADSLSAVMQWCAEAQLSVANRPVYRMMLLYR
jgi:predicted DNA-binding transcriptional regulator AlpA